MKTAPQNLWDAAKAVIRRKYITLSAYIFKKESFKC